LSGLIAGTHKVPISLTAWHDSTSLEAESIKIRADSVCGWKSHACRDILPVTRFGGLLRIPTGRAAKQGFLPRLYIQRSVPLWGRSGQCTVIAICDPTRHGWALIRMVWRFSVCSSRRRRLHISLITLSSTL
jgi:hypothetical protein